MKVQRVIRPVGRWLTRHRRGGSCGKGTEARTKQSGNFNRFTDRARRVMQLAQEEAQRLQHNSIGTEHLLLGLLREREGVAGKVLTSMGVDLDQARQAVEGIVDRGDHLVSGEIRLTPRTSSRFSMNRGSPSWCAPFAASSKTRCSAWLPDQERSLSATNASRP